MKSNWFSQFDRLEARQLLSTVHAAVAHAAVPLVISGTLKIDNNPHATGTIQNPDGSTTTTLPVAGQLGTFGEVKGIWSESVDAYGDYEGPDTLRLHDSRGAFTIAFNNSGTHATSAIPRGPLSYSHAQALYDGTRAFAHASESGSIEVTTNAARTQVASLTLLTTNT